MNCITTFLQVLLALEIVTLVSSDELSVKVTRPQNNGLRSKQKVDIVDVKERFLLSGDNECEGEGAKLGLDSTVPCFDDDGAVLAKVQAGSDVSVGYKGDFITNGENSPYTKPFYTAGMCPVNVHWHLGSEHRSEGEFDEEGSGPTDIRDAEGHRTLVEGAVRLGLQCHYYDKKESMFTEEYNWQHCVDTHVGETYEVHWPHSVAGACGTVNQYQSPFLDGLFCRAGNLQDFDFANLQNQIGVQAQVFTIVNNEDYYYPDLMRGMIVDSSNGMGSEVTKYTGSSTGTIHNNTICSSYAPITWHVDRKCHMISASAFDKMCSDMQSQRDDMSEDLHAHGSREIVDDALAADNHVNRKTLETPEGFQWSMSNIQY